MLFPCVYLMLHTHVILTEQCVRTRERERESERERARVWVVLGVDAVVHLEIDSKLCNLLISRC